MGVNVAAVCAALCFVFSRGITSTLTLDHNDIDVAGKVTCHSSDLYDLCVIECKNGGDFRDVAVLCTANQACHFISYNSSLSCANITFTANSTNEHFHYTCGKDTDCANSIIVGTDVKSARIDCLGVGTYDEFSGCRDITVSLSDIEKNVSILCNDNGACINGQFELGSVGYSRSTMINCTACVLYTNVYSWENPDKYISALSRRIHDASIGFGPQKVVFSFAFLNSSVVRTSYNQNHWWRSWYRCHV